MSEWKINIGDTFYVFDANRRRYRKDEKGFPVGGPIFREHFEPVRIVGETSRSWVTDWWGKKVPKNDPWSVLYTPSMIDDAEWKHHYGFHIGEAVRRLPPAKLREVAGLIGWKPRGWEPPR